MRPDPEEFRSAFINQKRAGNARGSFGSYLGGGNGSGDFAAGMQSSFSLPDGAGRSLQEAYASNGDAFTSGLLDAGLGAVNAGQEQAMALGSQGVRSAQGLAHAKRMAKLNASASRQQSTFGAISAGMGMLGSIGGAFQSRAAAQPAASSSSAPARSGFSKPATSRLYW